MLTRRRGVTYDQFDVVVVPFPFTESAATKKRPALVLSDSTNFNSFIDKTVMGMITTTSHASWPLDMEILDLQKAGLKQASIVRMKLFTLDNALVIRKFGSLSQRDRKNVLLKLKSLYGI